MREIPALYAFNRGLVSALGLARIDQKRIGLSAQIMTNWIARVLGSMSLRPGWGYLGSTQSNAKPRFLPFVFATDDTALIEFTDSVMRVWISDALLTRAAVSTVVTNGTFAGNINGWTDGSDVGGAVAWDTGNYMKLTGNGTARAIGYQVLTVSAGDQAKEHALHVIINSGPVAFKIGTALGDDSIFSSSSLDAGVHSLAFTPNTGSIYVQFLSSAAYKVQVTSCVIESAGTVTIESPYLLADLGNIRPEQSADIIFLACATYQQRKIERRGAHPGGRSWSLCVYHADDGPFRAQNISPTTITASALTGDITLTASTPIFRSTHVNGIFMVTSQVTGVSASISAQNTFTTGVKVTGSGTIRSLTLTLTGTWVATVHLQSSPDNSTWTDVPGDVWNSNVTGPYLDGLDGQTMYYRIGIKTGDYTSGTLAAALTFTSGTLPGIARITAYNSSTVVSAQVLSDMGSTSATAVWSEGSWSGYRGWPTAVRLHEGRMWWFGQNGIFGSVSDAYFSYDANVIGASGPLNRTIGAGPVDTINWGLSLQRLIVGAQGAEFSCKSSALDVPITPTDFSIKPASTQGSTNVDILKSDQRGLFVDRTGLKVFEVTFDLQTYEYGSNDLTAVVPELGSPGLVRGAIQRKPDTRMHWIRSDGTVMVGITDKVEDVLCWLNATTNGTVVDAVVLPGANGSTEDQVYYAVNRTINGATVHYLEKWAKETECRGGTLNKQADAFIVFTNSPASSTVTGLGHLIGASVVVWADGVCLTDATGAIAGFTVGAGGTITLTNGGNAYSATTGVVGLTYTAPWQSAKLGLASQQETSLAQTKRISHLGIIAAWLHPKGIKFGPDFDHLDDLPTIERGAPINQNTVRTEYDEQEFPFPGTWTSDARLCMQAQAPRPATILAAVIDMEQYH